MATGTNHKEFRQQTFKIDNAARAITAITSHVNQASLDAIQDVMENTAASDDERTYISGLAGATVSFNWFVNSTTEGIFGPLMGNRTGVTKTFEYYNGLQYYNGEAHLTGIQQSGSTGDLIVGSANLTFNGAVNRTSKAL